MHQQRIEMIGYYQVMRYVLHRMGKSRHQKCWRYNLVKKAGTWALVMVYSSVENWGISSAGWFCSLMAAYCE